MKKILIICFTLTTILSFGQDTIIRHYKPYINFKSWSVSLSPQQRINNSVVKVVDLSGNVRFIGQVWSDCGHRYSGETKEFYRNGKIKAIRNYSIGGQRCPNRNGESKYYYKNGKLKKTVMYKDGNKISETKS